MQRHRHRAHADEGAILPIAVVVVLVFGVLAASLAGYGAVSFRHHRVVRQQTALRASAEAGLRFGLEQLRTHQTLCTDEPATSGDLTITVPFQPNSHSVSLTCRYVSGNLPAANQWAIILTGIGTSDSNAELQSQAGSSTLKRIDGPVYVATTSPAATVSNLQSAVRINEGDLWYYDASCPASVTAPTLSNLTLSPSPPRAKLCTTKAWSDIAPAPPLPPKPLPIDPPGRDDIVPGCRIFYPGAYYSPPALRKGDNYFISGEYYFEFDDTLEIKQADVQGGQPDPYSDDVSQFTDLAPNCAQVVADDPVTGLPMYPAVTDSETGYGATFILGGESKLEIGAQARVEIYSRAQGDKNVSIAAVNVTGSGYSASTVTMADPPILDMKAGNTNDLVLHGEVWAPLAQVAFGNVTNTVSAQVTGGVVAASVVLQGSASATGWVVGRATRPSATKVLMTSTARDATGISVTVQAVVDYRLGRNVDDASTTINSSVVVSNSGHFTSADVGSYIIGPTLAARTTIVSVLTPAIVLVSSPAIKTKTNASLTIRTAQVAVNSWRKL